MVGINMDGGWRWRGYLSRTASRHSKSPVYLAEIKHSFLSSMIFTTLCTRMRGITNQNITNCSASVQIIALVVRSLFTQIRHHPLWTELTTAARLWERLRLHEHRATVADHYQSRVLTDEVTGTDGSLSSASCWPWLHLVFKLHFVDKWTHTLTVSCCMQTSVSVSVGLVLHSVLAASTLTLTLLYGPLFGGLPKIRLPKPLYPVDVSAPLLEAHHPLGLLPCTQKKCVKPFKSLPIMVVPPARAALDPWAKSSTVVVPR